MWAIWDRNVDLMRLSRDVSRYFTVTSPVIFGWIVQ